MDESRSIEILLVEDNPGDVRLTLEALREHRIRNSITVVGDGETALRLLHRKQPYCDAQTPNLILLDLNVPRKSGQELLADIKSDPALRRIPVVVLTSSYADRDVLQSYDLQASCYVAKPVDFEQFVHVMRSIEDFWLSVVRLP